jgi:hypothetical protein
MKIQVFCDYLDPEGEGSKLLQKTGIYVPLNMLQQASVTVFISTVVETSYLTS